MFCSARNTITVRHTIYKRHLVKYLRYVVSITTVISIEIKYILLWLWLIEPVLMCPSLYRTTRPGWPLRESVIGHVEDDRSLIRLLLGPPLSRKNLSDESNLGHKDDTENLVSIRNYFHPSLKIFTAKRALPRPQSTWAHKFMCRTESNRNNDSWTEKVRSKRSVIYISFYS